MTKPLTDLLAQLRALKVAANGAPLHAHPGFTALLERASEVAPNVADEWHERVACDVETCPVWPEDALALVLLRRLWAAAPEDTQDQDDAFNALCDALSQQMTEATRDRWEAWNLKATGNEIVQEGFALLGLRATHEPRSGSRPVPVMTRAELIEQGFEPSAQRARLSVPFSPVECCTSAAYIRLPPAVQVRYLSTPDADGLHHRR